MNWMYVIRCLLMLSAGVALAACEPYPDAAADPGANLPAPAALLRDEKEPAQAMDAEYEMLTGEERKRSGWDKQVGQGLGLWISVAKQKLRVVEDCMVIQKYTCSTAKTGVGARFGSYQTPPGWHRIVERIGDGEPEGRVFRSRAVTAKIWKPGEETPEDLVLTRVFILEGLEPGINKGKDAEGFVVDSLQRFIYIHGTNDVKRLGEPASKGCIRLDNKDIIRLFNEIPVGTLVYIDPDMGTTP